MLKTIDSLSELQNIKKIKGYDNYYRLRVGDYRLGLKLSGNTVEVPSFEWSYVLLTYCCYYK